MGEDCLDAPAAKKRAAARQISKDNGAESDGEDSVPAEAGSFKKASDEVLASRRIVKVRRSTPDAAASRPNPFASVRLVPPSAQDAPAARVYSSSMEEGASKVLQSKSDVRDSPCEASGGAEGSKQPKDASTEPNGIGKPNTSAEKGPRAVTDSDDSRMAKLVGGEKVPENGEDYSDNNEGQHVEEERNELKKESDVVSQGVDTLESGTGSNIVGEQLGNPEIQVLDNQSANAEGCTSGLSENVSSGNAVSTLSESASGSVHSSSIFSFAGTSSTASVSGFAFFSNFGSGSASGTNSGSAFAFRAASDGNFSSSSMAFTNTNGSSFISNATSGNSITALPASQSTTTFQFQQIPLQTGEEHEKAVFASDATLYEFAGGAWKERGKGELKLNVSEDNSDRPRLLMWAKGNYKLLLNARLFPDMKLTSMDSKRFVFACMNTEAEEKNRLTTYAVKFRDTIAAGGFKEAVDAHKGETHGILKTPDNSPRAVHDSGTDDAVEP